MGQSCIKKAPGQDTAGARAISSLAYLDEKSSIVSVIPDSIFHFKRHPDKPTRFMLQSTEGDVIAGFPSTYERGADKGRKYIVFRKMEANHLKNWTYSLELAGHRMFTGVNLKRFKDGTARGFGDDRSIRRKDCVLVALSADGQFLDVALVSDKADRAEEVYEAWIDDYIRERLENEQLS